MLGSTQLRETRVQILKEGRNCWRVRQADRAAVLIDGASYFAALAAAMAKASRSILIIGWDFDGRIRLGPGDGTDEAAPVLRDLLLDLVKRRPELHVRILIWDMSVFFAFTRDSTLLFGGEWRDHPRIDFRFRDRHPFGAAHHEKIVCIDDRLAFVGGIDLTLERWDVHGHPAVHPGRVTPDGVTYRPVHDLQMAIDGEAASSVSALARAIWSDATGEVVHEDAGADPDPWPANLHPQLRNVPVGIARTWPAYAEGEAVREVEMLILDAISAAREWIYIEAQYLTSFRVGERLAELLKAPDGPQILVLVRAGSEGWIEHLVMGTNRDRLLALLREADRHDRFRAFYPVTGEDDKIRINLHAKLVMIDGRLLRIGSSNLNNRSMGSDTECDLVVEAPDAKCRAAITDLRDQLLAEHMAVPVEEVRKAVAAEGLIAAVDRLNARHSRLTTFAVETAPTDVPVLGTGIADPEEPIDRLFRRDRPG